MINRRDALALAARLGAVVKHMPATGEVKVIWGGKTIRVNNRKKDAPRELVVLLKRMRESKGGAA